MTEKYTEDKRLLGALDYIDDKFIAEVTESYKIFEPSDGKITARRTLKISLRQFAALAACLILLSAAFPVTNYVVKAIKNFAAGWGSEITSVDTAINIDTYDVTENDSEMNIDSLDTSDMDNNLYDKYILTEEDLSEINYVWNEAFDENYADTIEEAMDRWMPEGKCYYGKYGDCIVVTIGGQLQVTKEYIVGNYRFFFSTFHTMIVFYNKELYSIEMAYENGYLSDEDIGRINEFHIEFMKRTYGDYDFGGPIK